MALEKPLAAFFAAFATAFAAFFAAFAAALAARFAARPAALAAFCAARPAAFAALDPSPALDDTSRWARTSPAEESRTYFPQADDRALYRAACSTSD